MRFEHNSTSWFGIFIILAIAMIFFIVAIGGGFSVSTERVQKVFDAYGFTNAKVGDRSWFGCGNDYTYSHEFTAVSPRGVEVSGTICCGISKGCTLKF